MRRTTRLLPLAVGVPLVAAAFGGSVFLAILGIGFLIFIHEWGHYMACVLTGTKTEAFSVGFGPRLFGWERDVEGKRRFTVGAQQLDPADGGMDFRVAAIPLGGYVKMAGGELIGESSTNDPGHFVNKPASARIFIVCAGVIMNIVTAFVFYAATWMGGKPVLPPVVGETTAGGPAWQAGLMPGDTITSMNGDRTRSFYDVRIEAAFGSGDAIPVTADRGGRSVEVDLRPIYDEELGRQLVELVPSVGMTLRSGDDELVVGRNEHGTVAGVPFVGGIQLQRALEAALSRSSDPVPVETKDGRIDFALDPKDPPKDPPRRVGLELLSDLHVKALRPGVTGIEIDDRLVAVERGDARAIVGNLLDWQQLLFDGLPTALVLSRDGAEVRVPLPDDANDMAGAAAWLSHIALEAKDGMRVRPVPPGRIARLPGVDAIWRYEQSVAGAAGIVEGEEIANVSGVAVDAFSDVTKSIGATPKGMAIELGIKGADGTVRQVSLVPAPLAWAGRPEISIQDRVPLETEGLVDSLGLAATTVGREVANVFRTIGSLFSGRLSFNKNIAGPITLVTASKDFADRSWTDFLWFLAYVSVMLAVLNILPIPVLDGGHLLFIIIEKIKGSPLKEAVMIKAMYIGMALLLTLMFFAFKNDIQRLL